MAEVELTSELMILQLAGLQDKKKSINVYYEQFDDRFPERDRIEQRFRAVVDVIGEFVGEWLGTSEFHRPPLFYTLYGAVYHRLFGMPKQDMPTLANGRIPRAEGERLRDTVLSLSEVVSLAKQDEEIPQQYERFVTACLRQTDNIRPRQIRLSELYSRAFS
jgi:hypothetical protein